MKNKKGRSQFLLAFDVLSNPSFTFTFFLFPLATAFLSCTKNDGSPVQELVTPISIESKAAVSGAALDIFVYNLDKLRRLDSHTRRTAFRGLPLQVEVGSRSGMKRVIALAGWPQEALEDWAAINCLDNIVTLTSFLADENPSSPRMTGSTTIRAGTSGGGTVSMQALGARIKLVSVCCDFSGKAYEGLTMQNARIYLTNVCVSATISPDDIPGTAFVNIGGYSEGDMSSFGAPELLERRIYGDIGPAVRVTDISLYCYPCEAEEEGAGRPQTKLVLEGDIGGRRYYYPVRLADYTGGAIRRDVTYNIDLKITRLGGDDPEAPLAPDTFEAGVTVLPWEETGSQTVDF